MSWFKRWPKDWQGKPRFPVPSEPQLNKIDSDHYVYNYVWSDKQKKYYLYRGYNLRNILWNHTDL